MTKNDKVAMVVLLALFTGFGLLFRAGCKYLKGDYKKKEPSIWEMIDSANARNARNYNPKRDSPQYYNNYPKTSREDQILRQFNVGSGAHRKLERWVKQNMNDPESYHHISSSYADKGKYLLVQIKFRGKNSYGAMVVNMVTAKVSLDGDILEIVD